MMFKNWLISVVGIAMIGVAGANFVMSQPKQDNKESSSSTNQQAVYLGESDNYGELYARPGSIKKVGGKVQVRGELIKHNHQGIARASYQTVRFDCDKLTKFWVVKAGYTAKDGKQVNQHWDYSDKQTLPSTEIYPGTVIYKLGQYACSKN